MRDSEITEIYDIVEKAILAHASSAVVPCGTTRQNVKAAVREVMRDNPGIFWFSHQWTFDKDTNHILLRYTLSKDRARKASKSIDDVVENDFFQGRKEVMMTWPEARRVAYVYKWVAGYCCHSVHSAYNQTIYGVFVHRNSVCTGIAKATQHLLKQLDIESRLVFGRLHNSDSTSLHCWLMVKVEGRWYHHDPTFALPSLAGLLRHSGEEEIVSDGLVVWNGFLTNTEAIQRTRTIEEADTLPLCADCLLDKSLSDVDVKLLREPNENGNYRGCLLAFGKSADIYQHRSGYVVKVFHRDVGAKLLEQERAIMSRLKGCKHLLQIDDTDNEKNGLVIEQATPLTDLLRCHYYQLTAQGLCLLLRDVVEGIMECRERGVIYRDIHPANIYMTTDGSYKLGDFGSCYIQGQSPCEEGGLASKWFMAPETYKKGIFDERSQVYMVAMVAYYLLNNSRPPFWDDNREGALDVRMSGEAITMPATLVRISAPGSAGTMFLDVSEDDFGDNIVSDKTFAEALQLFLAEALSFEPDRRYSNLVELLRAIEGIRKLTIDHSEGDECDCDSEEGDSGGSAYVIPGDNPLLIYDGSDSELSDDAIREGRAKCATLDLDAKSPTPNSCSPRETNGFMLVSDGGQSDTTLSDDTSGFLYDLADEIEPYVADFCTTEAPFYMTMRGTEQEGGKAWPEDLPRTSPGLARSAPPSQHRRSSYEALPKAQPSESPEYTYGPIIPENVKTSIPRVSVPISSILSFCASPFRKETRSEDVYSSVFAPAEVKKGTNMLVQVFLHTAKHKERVQSIASQADKNAEKRGYTPLSCKMKKGDKADVEINIYGEKLIKSEKKSIVWNGEYTQCSFRHFVNQSTAADNLYCEVNIYVNGVPVGCTSFLTEIVSHEAQNIYARQDAKRFEKIFVSYSHLDYERVKYLVQGFRAQGIDYFFDRDRLRSGDVYNERIFGYIDKADLFMLCWSENARKSTYVEREIKRALSHAYPQVAADCATLRMHPVSIEPRADLPPYMRDIYHFEEL